MLMYEVGSKCELSLTQSTFVVYTFIIRTNADLVGLVRRPKLVSGVSAGYGH